MQLPQPAIDLHQPGHRASFFLEPRIAPRHYFAHAGEIVVALHRADDEFAVIGLLHPAVFPHHHAGHLVGALYVGDVEALDAVEYVAISPRADGATLGRRAGDRRGRLGGET